MGRYTCRSRKMVRVFSFTGLIGFFRVIIFLEIVTHFYVNERLMIQCYVARLGALHRKFLRVFRDADYDSLQWSLSERKR